MHRALVLLGVFGALAVQNGFNEYPVSLGWPS
jgi:hypothetical protein